jgi:hypothetical protein
MSAAATAPPPSAGDIYNEGVSLLAAQLPVEALAAFTRAAELGTGWEQVNKRLQIAGWA